MKVWQSIGLLILVWAAIYLPSLGSQELRGEEARRILPAQAMLDTGDWIVPRIAGEVYANKPPLINWMIAASFHLTGSHSEFAARLPSVISILALAIGAFLLLGLPYGQRTSLYVGLILLTSIAMIDKCRMAEIEAVYITLFGLACFSWIHLWTGPASPWATWTIPYIFLGVGMLAKGPTHLIFWILLLFFTLSHSSEKKTWRHPAHLIGIAIGASIFLPWMFLNILQVGSSEESVGNWSHELAKRADFSQIDFEEWAMHPLEMLANFLPWTVPLLFALGWAKRSGFHWDKSDRKDSAVRGGLWASAATAGFLCLLPEGLPRYLMPVYPLLALGTAHLIQQVSSTPLGGYERFARVSLKILVPVFAFVVVGLTAAAVQRSLSVLWIPVVAGLVGLGFGWRLASRSGRTFLVTSPVVFSLAAFALFSAVHPHWLEREKMPAAAEGLDRIASADNRRLVIFADPDFREFYSRELRLLYYLNPDHVAIGESSPLPNERMLVAGRPGLEKLLGEKKAEFTHITEGSYEVDGRELEWLALDPKAQ